MASTATSCTHEEQIMPAKKKAALSRHRTQYTPYGHTATVVVGPGARQSMKDECDINNIVARYEKTGVLTHLNASQATYADVSELTGYRDALDKVTAAKEVFMKLPSELRAVFDNDPAKFLDFIGTATPEELTELGMAEYGNKSGTVKPDEEPDTGSENSSGEESG